MTGNKLKAGDHKMRMQSRLVAAGVGIALCLSMGITLAQNNGGRSRRGNLDPAQMQQRMMDRYKEILEISNDDEWHVMQPMIQKVIETRRDSFPGGMGRGMIGSRRGGRSGGDQGRSGGGSNAMRRGPGREPSPEAEALQKAIEAKGSPGEIKAALSRYVELRKVKTEQLKTARETLRKVLTARQEAIATLIGLL
jgi:hypothetical protein